MSQIDNGNDQLTVSGSERGIIWQYWVKSLKPQTTQAPWSRSLMPVLNAVESAHWGVLMSQRFIKRASGSDESIAPVLVNWRCGRYRWYMVDMGLWKIRKGSRAETNCFKGFLPSKHKQEAHGGDSSAWREKGISWCVDRTWIQNGKTRGPLCLFLSLCVS